MKYLLDLRNQGIDSWVATNHDIDADQICHDLTTATACISDIDGTEMYATGKVMAATEIWEMVKPPYGLIDIQKLCFLGYALVQYWRNGKDAESIISQDSHDLFLSTKEKREKVTEQFTPELFDKLIYTGVLEVYQQLHLDHWQHLTVNTTELGKKVKEHMGSDAVTAEAFNKAQATRDIVHANPYQHYILRGNSRTDHQALDVLKEFEYYGKLKVDGIYVAKSPREMNSAFTINTSRNHTALAMMLEDFNDKQRQQQRAEVTARLLGKQVTT